MKNANHIPNADMLVLELLWRDYFRFMFKKHGQQFYKAETDLTETKEQDEFF